MTRDRSADEEDQKAGFQNQSLVRSRVYPRALICVIRVPFCCDGLEFRMHQVLFTIPFFKEMFPPGGIPVYGFGAMLFLTFIAVTVWGGRRANAIGLPPTRFQDF